LSKVRRQTTGARYAEQQLVSHGAPDRRLNEAPTAWLNRVLLDSGFFKRIFHPGNHTYGFGLDRPTKALLPQRPENYPKLAQA